MVFSGSGTGIFQFNTVRGGGEIRPGGIDCGTTSRSIRDSIVVGSFPAARAGRRRSARASTSAWSWAAGTRGRTRASSRSIRTLDSQGRLLDTPADAACCIDRGARYVSSLYRDFFGTPRPQGLSNDIGAHELR